jgi:serine/threonine-protein kinase RsbW
MTPASGQGEQAVGADAGAGSAGLPASLELTVGAQWIAPSVVRHRVEAWLQALRWPVSNTEELVLAISEAVSNSVEHGYLVPPDAVGHPGVVHVRGRVLAEANGAGRAEFTVRDGGRWREPRREPSNRGHGMLIMRSCVDRFTLEHGPAGTTVVLVSHPAPLAV